jgi:hypothetical protein
MRFFGHNGFLEISVTDEQQANALASQGYEEYPSFCPNSGWKFVNGEWIDPTPPPTFSQIFCVQFAEVRHQQSIALPSLVSIQLDLLSLGDSAGASAVMNAKTAVANILTLVDVENTTATDLASLKALYEAEWQRIKSLLPAAYQSSFVYSYS